ncbi:hypothetical protein FE257_005269 [Aspergillus nanangensis]|uniref:Uncharacterized protein n=1 Tax=Aspergillus nanangensis TaxID=2582783 RepID=A0AAD4GVN6_ASPNN|nr:hypothetical protein FE257_005269 [Aspergillus nanangensis]
MDGFDATEAPLEYQERLALVHLFTIGMGIGWTVNYAGMVRKSFQQQTYCMAAMPLGCNFAWEFTYCFVYPSKNWVERIVFLIGIFLNVGIMYSAIQSANNEWSHSALVMNHLASIFIIMTFVWLTGHLALGAQLGPSLAYSWGGYLCQLLLSFGGLCQLLMRGTTRGGLYTLWLSRFFGTSCACGVFTLRCKYWPREFAWLNCPLILWGLAVWLIGDISYGLCFWYIKQHERETAGLKRHGKSA